MHGATTDRATIVIWWNEPDIANVGIATGNGLLVLDIDAKHDGLASLAQLEAQHEPIPKTLRLSMLYALLDGVGIIDVSHLKAATAVWRYCDASARMIFAEGQGETADPLEQLLLLTIRQEPGINRRGLHRAIGGHIPAKEMVHALARLRDRGQARCEMLATGGRPSECWFPDVAPQPIVIATATQAMECPVEGEPGVAPATPSPALAQPSELEAVKLNLSELFDAVNAIGGNFHNDGNAVVVDASAGTLTPAIVASLADHQEWLASVYTPPSPVISEATDVNSDDVLTDEEFFAEMQSM